MHPCVWMFRRARYGLGRKEGKEERRKKTRQRDNCRGKRREEWRERGGVGREGWKEKGMEGRREERREGGQKLEVKIKEG